MPVRFALLIAGLCRLVAAHIANDRTAGPWIVLIWSRLRHIAGRVERLSAQARAGTVPKLRAGFTLTTPCAPSTIPPIVLPRHAAWLIQAIPQAAVYGGYLRQMLDDPEMAALLTAAPQLARILRPLCRALGVPPPPRPPRAPSDSASSDPAAAIPAALRKPERPPAPARPMPARPMPARAAPVSAAPLLKPA